jgi:hypothetical protein
MPTLPGELVLALSFTGLLALCAVFATIPGLRPHGLVVWGAFVAVSGWWSKPSAGAATGAMTWPFYVGWVIRGDGDLIPRGWTSLLALAFFVGIALAAAAVRRMVTWPTRRRAAVAVTEVQAVDVATLFYPALTAYPALTGRSKRLGGTAGPDTTNAGHM